MDDELAVFLRYVDPGAEGIQIFRYDVSAYLHEILVEYIPVAGVIKMHHRLLVLKGEIEGGDYGRLEAVEGVMFVDDLFRFFHYDALDERHVKLRLPIGFLPVAQNRYLAALGWPVEKISDTLVVIRVETIPLVEELLRTCCIEVEEGKQWR